LDFGYLEEVQFEVRVQYTLLEVRVYYALHTLIHHTLRTLWHQVRPTAAAQLSEYLQELMSIDSRTGKKRAGKKRKGSTDNPPAAPEELATEKVG
jgi:hypothetical protein